MLNYDEIRKKIEKFKGTSEEALALNEGLLDAQEEVRVSVEETIIKLAEEFNELSELIQKKVEEAVEREGEEDQEEEEDEREEKPVRR